MVSLNFSKNLKLQTEEYTLTFETGSFYQGNYIVAKHVTNPHLSPKLGVIIAKKKCAKAVWRNYYKRQIRESFRQNQHKITNTNIVIIARHNICQAKASYLRKDLEKLWVKLAN